MKEKIIKTIKKYNLINPEDKIILGVSGGPDSIAMLDILNQLKAEMKFEIIVVHINHSIRGNDANEDEQYVKEYCQKRGIECYTKKIDVPMIAKNEKMGIEETGRIVRYKYFDEILQKTNSNKIAIAHNKNDKVETIIMHLLRGSGVSGLKGIEPIREGKYIKPLIECDRKEIEEYCEKNNLQPKIDKTNFENDCTRNKIRNIVIPYIKEQFNPNIIETITRLSEVVTNEDEYIEKLAYKEYSKILIDQNEEKIELKLKEFNILDNVIKNRIILIATKKLFGSTQGIEMVNIQDIIKLCNNNIGNKFLMPNKNLKILIKDKKIHFIKNS